jgi:hypothetical protein
MYAPPDRGVLAACMILPEEFPHHWKMAGQDPQWQRRTYRSRFSWSCSRQTVDVVPASTRPSLPNDGALGNCSERRSAQALDCLRSTRVLGWSDLAEALEVEHHFAPGVRLESGDLPRCFEAVRNYWLYRRGAETRRKGLLFSNFCASAPLR